MIAPRTSTIITSSSVKPDGRSFTVRSMRAGALVADIAIFALAAFLAVGAERDQVEGFALSGHRVAVIVPPRILEVRLLPIRSLPLVDAGRLLHERLQGFRVAADLQAVHLDVPGQIEETNLRLLRFRLPHLLEDLRADVRHEAGDQDEDDHDLEDREAALAAVAIAVGHWLHLGC